MSDRDSRIDATARELFVGWASVVDAPYQPTPPDDHARHLASRAYKLAAILEEARPVTASDALAPRPLAIGDRVRGLGGWTGTRGEVAEVYHDGAVIVVKADGVLGSVIHSTPTEWELEK